MASDYGQTQVPLVFVEPTPQPSSRKPERERSGGGGLAILLILLLGAAIAAAGGFYWMWQGSVKQVEASKVEVANAQKASKQLTDEKTALAAQLDKAQQALVPYGEIERLKGATQAERLKIAELLKIPSKVEYWNYHKPVDQADPIIREPAEQALKVKLDQLQKLSNDIGVWAKPAGPAPAPAAGTIRPSQPPT